MLFTYGWLCLFVLSLLWMDLWERICVVVAHPQTSPEFHLESWWFFMKTMETQTAVVYHWCADANARTHAHTHLVLELKHWRNRIHPHCLCYRHEWYLELCSFAFICLSPFVCFSSWTDHAVCGRNEWAHPAQWNRGVALHLGRIKGKRHFIMIHECVGFTACCLEQVQHKKCTRVHLNNEIKYIIM